MSLEDLEIHKHTKPIQAELDKQKDKNGRLKTELKELHKKLAEVEHERDTWKSQVLVDLAEVRAIERERDEAVTKTKSLDEDLAKKYKTLDEAITKWLTEAHALSLKTDGALSQMRREFGPGISVAWAMGTFYGPCAHGRDPYTRCDECEMLSPLEAMLRVRNVGVAKAIVDLTKALETPSLWEKPKGPQGADQYAGMPPAIRLVAGALTNLKATEEDAVSWYSDERTRIAQQVRDRVRHELYGRFPNELVDKFVEKLNPEDLLGE